MSISKYEKKRDDIGEYAQKINAMLDDMHPMKDYENAFAEHCSQSLPRISTGCLSLDKVLSGGLVNELYIMAAETSTGKSAITMNIAQNIAESKTADVLYFALEMSRDELIARGILAISYEHYLQEDEKRPLTAGDILYWHYDDVLHDFARTAYKQYETYANEYFSRYGEHLYIVEGGVDGLCAKDIANIAAKWKRQHPDRATVVFIDYLQIIKADQDDRAQTDRKTKTDTTVTILKTLASQIGMPVMAISSVSRANYNGTISTASFKESGDTEYTAGVLLGWNWRGVTDETDPDKRAEEKAKCKERGYRNMILAILKARNAERDVDVKLKYYPKYNYFQDEDDFARVHPGEDLPFDIDA